MFWLEEKLRARGVTSVSGVLHNEFGASLDPSAQYSTGTRDEAIGGVQLPSMSRWAVQSA